MTRNETSSPLSAKQQRAIAALLTKPTIEEAAKAAGVSRATLYRWLAERAFQTALTDAERRLLETTSRGLIALSTKALAVTEAVLDDQSVPASTRLRAADVTLNRLLQLRELVSLEERIAALEARLVQTEAER
jgi:hypothetical protein